MIKLARGYVAVANKLMASEKINFTKMGGVSYADREAGVVVFRADGVELQDIDIEKTVVVSLLTGEALEGAYDLPDDARLHLEIYRQFPHIQSIAHTYPEWSTLYSALGTEIPVFYKELLPILGRSILCAEELSLNEKPNSAKFCLSPETVNLISSQVKSHCGAILLKYDGVLSWDRTPIKALEYGKKVEDMAERNWRMRALSPIETDIKIPMRDAENYIANAQSSEEKGSLGVSGKRLTLDDERKICLEMLIYFDQVCRANGIKYSLTGGTLLGAVRHKGFIPWDDDIDVFLTRPEFDKLEAVFPDDARFIFVSRRKEPEFNYVFGRLIDTKTIITESPNTLCAGKGVFLDICVVDGLPKSRVLRNFHIAYMRFLMRARRATVQNPHGKTYREKGPIVVFLKKVLRTVTSYNFWNKRLERAMSKYPFDTSDYVGNFASQYGRKELLPRSAFSSYFDIPFEKYKFMACIGYEQYLTNIYGEKHMDIPAVNKRKRPHPNTAYWV